MIDSDNTVGCSFKYREGKGDYRVVAQLQGAVGRSGGDAGSGGGGTHSGDGYSFCTLRFSCPNAQRTGYSLVVSNRYRCRARKFS